MLPATRAAGLGFLPYFPLASGLLSGKYKKGQPAPAGTRLAATGGRHGGRFLTDGNLERADALESFVRVAPEQWHTFKPMWPATEAESRALEQRALAMLADDGSRR